MDYKKDVAPDNGGEENQDEDDGKGGNHGNTGLPYGLCKKYGIDLPEHATPRMAWNALKERKGVFPPWTKKGQSSGVYSEEENKTRLPISDNIEDYSTNVKTTSKTTEWQKKSVANAIGKVNEMVPLESLSKIDLTSRATKFLACACGGSLTVTTNFLRNAQLNPNDQYEKAVLRFKKNNQSKKERYLQFAQEAKEESTKALYRQYADEAVKFDRWTVAYENDGLSTSIYHELGHVVADQYFGMLNGKRFLVDGKAKISPERGQEIIRQAYRECKTNGEIYKISKYGAENVHEFFAESFAMYIAEEEELPSTVARMFKELKL